MACRAAGDSVSRVRSMNAIPAELVPGVGAVAGRAIYTLVSAVWLESTHFDSVEMIYG